MPDIATTLAIIALVALVEFSPAIRIPIGLLLAAALFSTHMGMLLTASLGATGVMIARISLALGARRQHRSTGHATPASLHSPLITRTTFMLTAFPLVPAGVIFPLIGAARLPLWPAIAGTLIGRIPVLALTTSIFVWLAKTFTNNDDDASALMLGVIAILLLLTSSLSRIDWQRVRSGGGWAMREPPNHLQRFEFIFQTNAPDGSDSVLSGSALDSGVEENEIIEGEFLGEETDDPPSQFEPK